MTLDPKITMKIAQYNQCFKWTSYVATLGKSLYATGQNGAMGNQWKLKRLKNQ